MEKVVKQQQNRWTVKKNCRRREETRKIYLETRVLTEISPSELDNYLCRFLLKLKKPNGDEYVPCYDKKWL